MLNKYILTEYFKNDDVLLLDDFKKIDDVIEFIEKKENKKLNKNSIKNMINKKMILDKYFITLDKI